MPTHQVQRNKVNVYRRENNRFWQCATFIAGRNHRVSTKGESVASAKEFAEDRYFELRGKFRSGEIKREKSFKDIAVQFANEQVVLTGRERNEKFTKDHQSRLNN